MNHFYPLFQDVDAECRCCGRIERFNFVSAAEQVVCAACRGHAGDRPSTQKLREAEHKRLWQADLQAWHTYYQGEAQQLRDSHQQLVVEGGAEIVKLRETVSDLRATLGADLSKRPVESIALWFEHTKIAEAQARTDRAHAFIGHLFRVLWAINQAHYPEKEAEATRCACSAAAKCEVVAAIAPVRDRLYLWESEQTRRLRAGLSHSLPARHPEVLKVQPWRSEIA